jgi:hypothetical protein
MRYLLLLAILLASCEKETKFTKDNVVIVEYEGCEYIFLHDRYKGMSAHKGNCKNPIHRCP